MIEAIQTLVDWVPAVVALTTAVCIFIFAPLAIFRSTRAFAGIGLVSLVISRYGGIALMMSAQRRKRDA